MVTVEFIVNIGFNWADGATTLCSIVSCMICNGKVLFIIGALEMSHRLDLLLLG